MIYELTIVSNKTHLPNKARCNASILLALDNHHHFKISLKQNPYSKNIKTAAWNTKESSKSNITNFFVQKRLKTLQPEKKTKPKEVYCKSLEQNLIYNLRIQLSLYSISKPHGQNL